jgi:DNA-binding FadR family transcriptional regulator
LKIAAKVADEIRQRIYRGYLRAGDKLIPEKEMVAHFGASRPTIREALRILEAEKLITILRGGGGMRVQPPNSQVIIQQFGGFLQRQGTNLEDIFSARILIEPRAVAHLALHATLEALQLLDANLARSRRSLEAGEDDDLNIFDFSALLVEHCGNKTLRLVCQILQKLIQAQIRPVEMTLLLVASQDAQAMRLTALEAREALVQAVRDREAELAADIWKKHISEASEYLLAAYSLDRRIVSAGENPASGNDLLGRSSPKKS